MVLISVLLVCASMASIPLNAATFEAKNNANHAVENNETTDLAFGWVTSAGGSRDISSHSQPSMQMAPSSSRVAMKAIFSSGTKSMGTVPEGAQQTEMLS